MTQEQISDEIMNVISLIDEVYSKFGFKYHIELSTRPEDSMGSEERLGAGNRCIKKTTIHAE